MAIYVISFMITIPVVELISQFMGVMYGVSEYILMVFSIAGLFLCSLNLLMNKGKRHWSDFFFITLHIFMFLSLIFSQNMKSIQEAAFGDVEYPYDVIGYYCAMFAAFRMSSQKYRKAVISAFVGISIIQFTAGVFQTFDMRIMYPMWPQVGYNEFAIYGVTQNANYYGGLTVLFFGLLTSLFIFTEKKTLRIFFGVLLTVCTYCSANSMARLAWVGDTVIILFLFISLTIMIRKKRLENRYRKYMKHLLFSLVVILAGVILAMLNPNERPGLYYHLFKITQEGYDDPGELGSGRLRIWYFCLASVPKHWLTGIGFSNLEQCFTENPEYINYIQGRYKTPHAHNVYIHILATQGVFSLINYMTFLIISTVKAVKKIINTDDNKERILTWTFLAMFTGYAVASFFNCRISYIEFYFYIVIGLMNPIIAETKKGKVLCTR